MNQASAEQSGPNYKVRFGLLGFGFAIICAIAVFTVLVPSLEDQSDEAASTDEAGANTASE